MTPNDGGKLRDIACLKMAVFRCKKVDRNGTAWSMQSPVDTPLTSADACG